MASPFQRMRLVAIISLVFIIAIQCLSVAEAHVSTRSQHCINLEKLKAGKSIVQHQHGTGNGTGNVTRERDCPEFNDSNLNFFLSLFLIIALGAAVRTFLRLTKLSVPYTVVLMLLGLLIGLGSRANFKFSWETEKYSKHDQTETLSFCSFWSVYTKIARMPPKIILYAFLPVLIFDSAFNMKVHVFMRSAWQILVLALPGMFLTTFLTAAVCLRLMSSYGWNFSQASLFGSIISATDPVAVVAILREVGASDTLGTMIEGESLLNDGVAILLFEIFEGIVRSADMSSSEIVREAGIKFLKIALGGPALGFVMAKLSVFWLSWIFNDAAVEITITLVAAYLTYYLGEALGVSGVVAVVVLGIVMNKDSTSISPEVEGLVHKFWEMIGYLANTVLFVLVGIVITETAINQIERKDWFHLIFFYIALNIVRFIMLALMMPWLCRIGYGLKWKDMIVIVWGGLRGAVGLCLSLQVYREKDLCNINTENKSDILGPKFLFHTAGIVILTLIINGTTTKGLLSALKLTELSVGKKQDMAQAVKGITGTQMRTISSLKQDRFLADANWTEVEERTKIHNPYLKYDNAKARKRKRSRSVAEKRRLENKRRSQHSVAEDMNPMDEYRELMEESRKKMLEALKVSFYRQFEEGILTEQAYHILVGVVNNTADKELHMIHSRDFKKYWHIHGIFPWIRLNIIKKLGLDAPPNLPPQPTNECRKPFWWLTTRVWFDPIIHFVVLLNLIPVIWETVVELKKQNTPELAKNFLYANIVFTLIYLLEFILKLIGHGYKAYFGSKWNYLDLLVLVVSIVDVIIGIIYANVNTATRDKEKITVIKSVVLVFRIIRITRSLRLLKPFLPRFYQFIDHRINAELFLGYDIGKGFVNGINDVLRYLSQMTENPKVHYKLKLALEHEKLETVLAIGKLHFVHTATAIGVKTRHACRSVLNAMRDQLSELKEDGLVDENESALLMTLIEEKMKRLWKTPTSLQPLTPEELLGNMPWVLGNKDITRYMISKAILEEFDKGQQICAEGDAPNGIYLIVKGMVKTHYKPSAKIIEAQRSFGIVPNMDAYFDPTFSSEEVDFLTTGTVIGELGVVTDSTACAQVICVTHVTTLHIKQDDMADALKKFHKHHDSLESRIWRSYGMRVGAALCPTQPAYQFWTSEKIRTLLERSSVPVGGQFDKITVPGFIQDTILIYGTITDSQTGEVYIAPTFLPHMATKLVQVEGAATKGRLLMIASEDVEEESGSATSLRSIRRTESESNRRGT